MEAGHALFAGELRLGALISRVCLLSMVPLLILMLLYVSKRIRTGRTRRRFPPGPPGLPVIGNLHQLGELPHISLWRLADKYGPLMHLQLGRVPTVVVSSADAAREVMKARDLSFCTRPALAALHRMSYGGRDISFAPYNEQWRQLRKIGMLEIFSARRVQSFRPIREAEVRVLVGELRRARGRPVNLSEMLLCLFNNVTCREVFGWRCSRDGECGRSRFHDLVTDAILVMGGFCPGDLFPSMQWLNVLTGWQRLLEKVLGGMDAIIEEEIVAHSRNNVGDGPANSTNSFIDILLQLWDDPNIGFPLSKEHLKGILMDMFLAGTDTAAACAEWAMSELVKNPVVMKKAQEEVRRAVSGEEVEEIEVQRLQYLKLVVKEVLRFHPPLPLLLPRECREDCEVHGYEIPAKTRVLVNAWAINRDPKYWEEPEVFRPERFEGSSVDYKGQHFQFLPFGAGRRSCPGIGLGIAGVELVLASLLYNFDWKLPQGISQDGVDMAEGVGIVIHRRSPLVLEATPRS